MKLTKMVLEFLATRHGDPIAPSFIVQALRIPRKRVHNLFNALADLHDAGKISWVGSEVVLNSALRKHQNQPPSKQKSRTVEPPQPVKTSKPPKKVFTDPNIDDRNNLSGKKLDAYIQSQSRELVSGRLIVKDEGYGFLVTETESEEDFYVPRESMGFARNGDKVLAEVRRFRGGRTEAYVERVLEKSQRAIIGLFVGGGGGGYVIPESLAGVRRIVIAGGQTAGAKDNQQVEVEIPDNTPLQETMRGRIVDILGYPGELATERATLLRMYGFPLNFNSETISAAESLSIDPDPVRDNEREDLTHLVSCTIDPVNAKDFDDAVTLEPDEDGWFAAVHIADVSYYLKSDDVIDQAAKFRATSVYLPQGASSMLPERLTGDICSLRPNEKRRAVSALFWLTSDGDIRETKIVRSWIKSRHRFNYEEVQQILDEYDRKRGAPDRWIPRIKAGISNPWEARLTGLRWFARKLRSERLDRGGIEFETAEVEIELAPDGKPSSITPRPSIESYRIIEEWMLLANRTVTEQFHIQTKHKLPFVYRIHEKPDDARLDEFIFLAEDLGYEWTGGLADNSKDFQRFVHSLLGHPETPVLMDLAIRSMMRAEYSTNNVGHFGLGFADYTHFTSPIRRYPDIMVHRLLIDHLIERKRRKIPENYQEILEDLCKHCSDRERAATGAEREGIKWKQVEYIETFIGKSLDAIVVAVKPRGIHVELIDTLAQTFIPVDRLGEGYLIFNPRHHELRSRNGVVSIKLGDRIRITIDRVDQRRHRFEAFLESQSSPVQHLKSTIVPSSHSKFTPKTNENSKSKKTKKEKKATPRVVKRSSRR